MTIEEIRQQCAEAECRAAAVSGMLPPIYRQAFECTLDGVLGNGNAQEKKQAAYDWMFDNYEMIGGIIYAAAELSEILYRNINDIGTELKLLGKADLEAAEYYGRGKEAATV